MEEKFPSKRKRKNFTPKKMVERTSVETNNILLETIVGKAAESEEPLNVERDGESRSDAKEDEDENIDVCF